VAPENINFPFAMQTVSIVTCAAVDDVRVFPDPIAHCSQRVRSDDVILSQFLFGHQSQAVGQWTLFYGVIVAIVAHAHVCGFILRPKTELIGNGRGARPDGCLLL